VGSILINSIGSDIECLCLPVDENNHYSDNIDVAGSFTQITIF
jgi:hypothetical protein